MNKLTILGLALAGSILLCAYWLAGPDTPLPPKQPVPAAPSAQASSTHSSAPQQPGKASLPPVASPVMVPAPLPIGTDRQVILQVIHEASISYDPVDLPRIQPYLSHPDPEIRVAALNGIVVLGHASGAPLLRDAANRAVSSEEAALLREKADYLELPSAYDLMKAKKLSLPKPKRPERKGKSATNLPQP